MLTLISAGLFILFSLLFLPPASAQDEFLPRFEIEHLELTQTRSDACFPVVYNGYLYSFALELEKPLWRIFIGGDLMRPYVAAQKDLYFYDVYNRVYAADRLEGIVEWVTPLEHEIQGRPVIFENFLILATLQGGIFVIDRREGDIVFRVSADSEISAGVQLYQDMLIVPFKSGRVSAYNVTLLQQEWEFRTGGLISVIPLVRDDKLYIGSWDSTVYAIDIETGVPEWARYVGSAVTRDFVAFDKRLILFLADGEVLSVGTEDGEIEWVRVFEDVEFNYNYFTGRDILYIFTPEFIALDPASGRTLFNYQERAYKLYKNMLFDNMVEGVRPIGEEERARLLREVYFSVQKYPYLPPDRLGGNLVYFVTDDDYLYVFDTRDKFFRLKHRIQ